LALAFSKYLIKYNFYLYYYAFNEFKRIIKQITNRYSQKISNLH
jgi:hypothetical protein